MSDRLRDQYLRLKRSFPAAVLFFRLGDCYETYDEDARIAARELALPLAAREFSGGERVPLCPLPYHTAELAIRRLVACGYSVAVCEQIGGPRLARGLVEREVVRVVGPSAAPARQRRPVLDHPDAKTVARRAGAGASPPAPGAGTATPLDGPTGGSSPGAADARAVPSTGATLSTSPRPAVQLPLFDKGEEDSAL